MEYEILDFIEEDYKKISKFINSEYRKDLKNVLAFKKSNTFLFLEEKKKLIIKEKMTVLINYSSYFLNLQDCHF